MAFDSPIQPIRAVRAIRAGAAGFLNKESAPEKLLEAVHKIAAGGRYLAVLWREIEEIAHALGDIDRLPI